MTDQPTTGRDPESANTEEDETATDAASRAPRGTGADLPPTTDDDGTPVENPSG